MTDWAKLAEPFPDAEVKMRPGAATWEHKPDCQGRTCRDTRDPKKHHQFSYVDARAVAQRLDDILTPEGWTFTCSVIPGSDIVKGRLEIGPNVREDHGYPNSERDDEPIKAATSDALKRCAVLFGIGRHLYDDNRVPAAKRKLRAVKGEQSTEVDAPAESIDSNASGETLIGRVKRRGIVRKGTAAGYKLEARQGPDGHVIGCRLEIDSDKNIPQVLFMGPAGEALFLATAGKAETLVGEPMTVAGVLYHVKAGQGSWYRLHVDAFEAADVIYPAPSEDVSGEAPSAEMFTADDMAAVDAQAGAA